MICLELKLLKICNKFVCLKSKQFSYLLPLTSFNYLTKEPICLLIDILLKRGIVVILTKFYKLFNTYAQGERKLFLLLKKLFG